MIAHLKSGYPEDCPRKLGAFSVIFPKKWVSSGHVDMLLVNSLHATVHENKENYHQGDIRNDQIHPTSSVRNV